MRPPAAAAEAHASPAPAPGGGPGALSGVLGTVLAAVAAQAPGAAPHVEVRPPTPGRTAAWPAWVPPVLVAALRRGGVESPWTHQAAAADLVWHGRPVVVATGTSSGKTLAYALPALAAALADGATTLYLSPTVALARDQAERLRALGVPGVHVAALDGESSPEERAWARRHAHVVLATPDLVHHSLLPGHRSWTRFLRRLRVVAVDECHAYRGVFGAHVAAVLRRLDRAAVLRGAAPTVVALSATALDPGPFASRLCGTELSVVDEDGSPHPGSATLVHAARAHAGPATADLLGDLVAAGLQVAAFTSSRRGAETLARRARRRLDRTGGGAGDAVVSYRGGHLAAERRAVEAGLRAGAVRGVATTSALEVGVDVAGLDAVLLEGWPGSAAALAQRSGRAGRGARPGVAVLVAGEDPVDAHLAAHPAQMLARPVEAGVTDTDNPYVLAPHLALAATESPLTPEDVERFGPSAAGVVAALEARGDLRSRPGGWFWARGEPPLHVDVRSAGLQVTLVEGGTGRVLGTVDEARAAEVAHPGAVYLHRWETYVVDDLDVEGGVAVLHAEDPGWVTVPRRSAEVTHGAADAESRLPGAVGGGLLRYGPVEVCRAVTGYVRRHAVTGAVLGEERLDLPVRRFATRAVTWVPDGAGDAPPAAAAAHAAEHVLVAMLPLVVACDAHDVAGHTGAGPQDGAPVCVSVHDSWPGGAGYAEQAFRSGVRWLTAAAERLSGCGCAAGCPSCVVRPGCERRNADLDKPGAARLLGAAGPHSIR